MIWKRSLIPECIDCNMAISGITTDLFDGCQQRSCFSDELMWESSLVSFHKENTDYIKFCHIVYCQRETPSYILLMQIAMIKVAAPRAVCKIIDRAIQVCGGAGVSQDYPLATM